MYKDSCTCNSADLMHKRYFSDPSCICKTCDEDFCIKAREEEKEDERIEATCTCKYKDSYHTTDQGGFENCYCETCENEECVYERQERQKKQAYRDEKDYELYKRLKTRFG